MVRTEKTCPRCTITKPIDDFNKCKSRADGHMGWCRQCQSDKRQADALHYRDYEMRRRYGISLADYERMYADQGGVCAICNEGCIQKPSLAIDHCHETGKVRGLLCGRCNQALGLLREDPELFAKAVTYLTERGEHV